MFINYSPVSGYSLNIFRRPEAFYSDDVVGFISDVANEVPACCPFEGALDKLKNYSLFDDDDYEVIEDLSNFLLYSI